ncbi:mucosa-associated lymphoid tissue lymphoma translocation protein 1-like [Dendronephthya gigantea]|uniref:mucosa-associated lymphoid tissue lymphoma translocation protein 1-like n=1 Tax=Dendronephthya gigantea TaxID=151771 RepID=UPI001069D6E2|nr:mucosa-associated lymphoid tissue lymphoma translocation protein 1-like [Dendronephthya gigantea]XP_028399101.1 mucosa-associated lymphoid tissue lymphoma translocation protein 1-like [Dendronephthya gigantea]
MTMDINTQLRKLPYGTLSKLDQYLELPSDKDWKALIAVMPSDRYTQGQVDMIQHNGGKNGTSCTSILIQDLGRLCVTLKELGWCLKKIGNYEALEALGWPNEPVVIKTQPECDPLREGAYLLLKVEAFGYPLPSYQWYHNGNEIPGEIYNELKIEKVTMAANGTYKCIVQNVENKVSTNDVTVRVMRVGGQRRPDPSVNCKPEIVVHPISAKVLPGQPHALHCQATGQQPMTYKWYKGDQPLMNTNNPTLVFPAFGEQNVGGYCCKISNEFGADISEEAELDLEIVDGPRNAASDKVAFLIGNQDYNAVFHEALQGHGRLQHTIADTKTLGSLLHRDDMGFNVLSFGNLTRQEMLRGIEEYVNLLSEDCYAFFYYAGHGFELNGKHYLLPVDAPADWKQEDAICVQWILELLWKPKPKMTVIILDMCRISPTGNANFEHYDFPTDLPKIVFGFATCSQSEAYERVDEANGIYMKHLKKHVCRDEKIEDILHAVTTDVEQDTLGCEYTERQRPEYMTMGGGYYSLRDPIEANGNRSAERWLQAHKLPERKIIETQQDGVKLEVNFEHSDWLSNSVNIFVRVVDPGVYDFCHAYIKTVSPDELEMHFEQPKNINSRSWPDKCSAPPCRSQHSELSTGSVFHLQRLDKNVTLTIALDCEGRDGRNTKYEVVAFSLRDFGLAQIFGKE